MWGWCCVQISALVVAATNALLIINKKHFLLFIERLKHWRGEDIIICSTEPHFRSPLFELKRWLGPGRWCMLQGDACSAGLTAACSITIRVLLIAAWLITDWLHVNRFLVCSSIRPPPRLRVLIDVRLHKVKMALFACWNVERSVSEFIAIARQCRNLKNACFKY